MFTEVVFFVRLETSKARGIKDQGTLIGGTRTSNWFLTKLGRYRN
jgi:hypothetical protein